MMQASLEGFIAGKISMRVIELQKSSDWETVFLQEASQIRSVLGDVALHVHHIGSTAVPGMAAKPVIDMILEVTSFERLDQSDYVLAKLGYESLGENGLPGRRFYSKGGDQRTHHLHAYESGHPDINRHRVFRDYLKAHKEKADLYERVKLDAASNFRDSPENYAQAKSSTIQTLEKEAMLWAKCLKYIKAIVTAVQYNFR